MAFISRITIVSIGLITLLVGCSTPDRPISRNLERRQLPIHRSQVEFTTNMGSFVVALYHNEAPVTVENFLEYVRDGHYNNTIFHRVVPDFMIQGGGFVRGDVDLVERPTRPAIRNEASNGLRNRRGTIAMARGGEKDSARSQFFINVAENTALDHGVQGYGYCVFGRVVEGMSVVDRIARTPTVSTARHPNLPAEDVVLIEARRLRLSEFVSDSRPETEEEQDEPSRRRRFLIF